MDEVRMLAAIVSDPHLLMDQVVRLIRWIKALFYATRTAVRDPGYDIVEIVSEGPPSRSLTDILRDPPMLTLEPMERELLPGDYLVKVKCTGDGCKTCERITGFQDMTDFVSMDDLPLRD
jgi:hypothetical protein